jgi:hypothetical protein
MVALSRMLGVVVMMALLIPNLFAQGSAQGYGQGGAGGGFGGGGAAGPADRMSDEDDAPNRKTKIDSATQAGRQEKTAILTPGDRVEFEFKLEAGQAFLGGVETDNFDAALAVFDEKGEKIAKNHDRAEGEQSPFLIYHTKKAETILVKVLSYRSAAGGRFTVRTRVATTIDLSAPSGTSDVTPAPNESFPI